MRLSVHIRERPFSNANLKKGQIMIDEASIRVMLSLETTCCHHSFYKGGANWSLPGHLPTLTGILEEKGGIHTPKSHALPSRPGMWAPSALLTRFANTFHPSD